MHLLSELPQMLAAEGLPLGEAQQRVAHLLQDLYDIIGALSAPAAVASCTWAVHASWRVAACQAAQLMDNELALSSAAWAAGR